MREDETECHRHDGVCSGNLLFTFNTFFPATNNIAIVGEMWQKEITERTNGAVEFDYLPGASLTAA